jgi:hypothetical protein
VKVERVPPTPYGRHQVAGHRARLSGVERRSLFELALPVARQRSVAFQRAFDGEDLESITTRGSELADMLGLLEDLGWQRAFSESAVELRMGAEQRQRVLASLRSRAAALAERDGERRETEDSRGPQPKVLVVAACDRLLARDPRPSPAPGSGR